MKDDVKAELEQFRQLGVERDYGLLLADDIRYSDFDRLRCLLIALDMHALEKDLVGRHVDRFRERIRQHEAVDCCDLDMVKQWEHDFLDAIPDAQMREQIRQRFEGIDGFY